MMNKIIWNIKQKWQKLTRGYSDEELWNLDYYLSRWIIPRLKTFKEQAVGFPPDLNSKKEWEDIIEKIIIAFELYISYIPDTPEQASKEGKQIREGLELFSKYFNNLWR